MRHDTTTHHNNAIIIIIGTINQRQDKIQTECDYIIIKE